jgi:integrase/recombinase XerD
MATKRKLPTIFNRDEWEAILGACYTTSTTGVRNRAILAVLLGSGLRVSEVCALRGADVDVARGMITVRAGKGGKDRTVPMIGEEKPWLQSWAEKRRALGLNGRHPFFVGLRTGLDALKPRYMQGLVTTLGEAAGVDGKRCSPHTFRHTFATRMLNEFGLSLRELQEVMGHADISTTSIYLHVDPEGIRRKVQGADDAQEAEAEGDVSPEVMALARKLMEIPKEQRKALAGLLGQ